MLVPGVGVQLESHSLVGLRSSHFYACTQCEAVVINEVISLVSEACLPADALGWGIA